MAAHHPVTHLHRRRACSHGVLKIRGELDIATAPDLAQMLQRDRTIGILDLSGITFIDAAGLSSLRAAIQAVPRPIRLRHPPPPLRRLLAIVGLDPATLEPPHAAADM